MRGHPACNAREPKKLQRFAVDFVQCTRFEGERVKKPAFDECCAATDAPVIGVTIHNDRTGGCYRAADRLVLAQLDRTLWNRNRGRKFTCGNDGVSLGHLAPLCSPFF